MGKRLHVSGTIKNAALSADDLITYWKSCASVVIRFWCITAHRTYPNSAPRRYSQSPGKPGIQTLNYGEGDAALAIKLGISKEEARKRKELYFKPYPGVKRFIEHTHASCRETLQVHTILGRIRRLVEANSDWKAGYYDRTKRRVVPERPGPLAARALRQAVNSIVQGSAADVARLAQILTEPDVMREIGLHDHNAQTLENCGVEQLLQIHDEILFEIPAENLAEGISAIEDSMSHPFRYVPQILPSVEFTELSIPLDVSAGKGSSWAEAH